MLVSAFVLAISGPVSALLLPTAPFIQKTWNYELGTFYQGGETGHLYFRTPTSSYHTEEPPAELGYVTYDATNPNHHLFSSGHGGFGFIKDPSLKANEDNWGLLRISEYRIGDISGSFRFGNTDITASPGGAYWNEGDVINGHETYLRGMMWGGQDQVIEVTGTNQYKWGFGVEFWIFILVVTASSFYSTWCYNSNNRSTFAVIVLHTTVNLSLDIFTGPVLQMRIYNALVIAGAAAIAAVWIVRDHAAGGSNPARQGGR